MNTSVKRKKKNKQKKLYEIKILIIPGNQRQEVIAKILEQIFNVNVYVFTYMLANKKLFLSFIFSTSDLFKLNSKSLKAYIVYEYIKGKI